MKYLIYFLAIIILLGLNLGLFNNLQIGGQIPNLLFLLAVFFSLEKRDFDFFFISLVSGLFLDFYSAGFFGAFTLALLLVSLLLHLLATNILVVEFNWKTLSFGLICSWLVFNVVIWAYNLAAFKFGWSSQYIGFKIFLSAFLPGFFYNWILLYPMYLVTSFLKRFVENLNIRSRGVVR